MWVGLPCLFWGPVELSTQSPQGRGEMEGGLSEHQVWAQGQSCWIKFASSKKALAKTRVWVNYKMTLEPGCDPPAIPVHSWQGFCLALLGPGVSFCGPPFWLWPLPRRLDFHILSRLPRASDSEQLLVWTCHTWLSSLQGFSHGQGHGKLFGREERQTNGRMPESNNGLFSLKTYFQTLHSRSSAK